MCYYLYGAVNKEVDLEDYYEVAKSENYQFNVGTKHNVKMAILNCNMDYRLTEGHCDCCTTLGGGNPDDEHIKELASLLEEYRYIKNINHVYLSLNWNGKINRREKTIHIDDINIFEFLANIEGNCLYKIELYQR